MSDFSEEKFDNKEWIPPKLFIIPFKNTKSGGPDDPPEDVEYNNPSASP